MNSQRADGGEAARERRDGEADSPVEGPRGSDRRVLDPLGSSLLRDGEDPRSVSELILNMVSVIQDHHRSADAREERARIRDERVMEATRELASQNARIDLIHRQYDELRVLLGNMSIAAGTPTPYVAPGFFPQSAQTAYQTPTVDPAGPSPFAGMTRGTPGISGEVPIGQKSPSIY